MLLDIDDAVNEARAKLVRAQKNVRGKSGMALEMAKNVVEMSLEEAEAAVRARYNRISVEDRFAQVKVWYARSWAEQVEKNARFHS